jgi:glutathione S-transferase
MITVHHLNQSRSTRVLWLLEELQAPYDVVEHARDAVTRLAPASLQAIHPLAKAPVIVDKGFTLCESGAVMEYILNTYGEQRLRPAQDSKDYYAYLEWLHFAEGSLALPVISSVLMSMEERGGKPLDGYIQKELALDFSYIEARLTDAKYFSGDEFSAADIMMTVMLGIAAGLSLLDNYPKTQAYLVRMQARPAYQKAAIYS